jgi:regulator of RNase E activity RraA
MQTTRVSASKRDELSYAECTIPKQTMGTASVSKVKSQINRPYHLISVGQYTVRKGELLVKRVLK